MFRRLDGDAVHGGFQAVIDLVGQELGGGLAGEFGELFAHLVGDGAVVDPVGDQPDEVVFGGRELRGDDLLDLADVLQFAGGIDDGAQVEGGLGELQEFGHGVLVDLEEVQLEKGLFVHLVGGVQIGEELEDLPVGEDRDARVGDVEVAEELAA